MFGTSQYVRFIKFKLSLIHLIFKLMGTHITQKIVSVTLINFLWQVGSEALEELLNESQLQHQH